MFGCVTSVGLYDRGARVIIWIALREAGFPFWLCVQHLDDMCAMGPANSGLLDKFYEAYFRICEEVGVSLASLDDPEKAFSPCTRGQMLGIFFDTTEWVWWLSKDKISRYVNDIDCLRKKKEATQREIWSVVGKVLYVVPLVPSGKYHIGALLRLNNVSENPNAVVLITVEVKEQLDWWFIFIQMCDGMMPIPSGYDECPPWAIECDSDAAGGSLNSPGRGVGAVLGKAWAQIVWPRYVNSNKVALCCQSKWRHKLSYLELCGHMLHLTAFAEEVAGRTVVTNIDNFGSTIIFKKGYDVRCNITDCLIRASNYVAVALGSRAFVRDITRCSTVNSEAADALSKSDFVRFFRLIPDRELEQRHVPRSFLRWLDNPVDSSSLGPNIVADLRARGIKTFL